MTVTFSPCPSTGTALPCTGLYDHLLCLPVELVSSTVIVPSGSIVTWSAWGGFPGNFDFSKLNFQVPAHAPAAVSSALRCNGIATNKPGAAKRENTTFITRNFIGYLLLRFVIHHHLVEGLT